MLYGKTAIVTGASRGIGKAIALKLAENGADIALVYSGNHEKAEEACEIIRNEYGRKAFKYQCDVSDYEAVRELAGKIKKDLGNAGILINNAGITKDGLVATMKEEDFDRVLDVDLKGAFNMIRHLTGMFLRNGEGVIINISSVSGLMGNPGQCNYSAAKAGLIGLTKSCAKELASKNIRCNAIAPGFIMSDMTGEISDKEKELIDSIPLKKMGDAEDVAEAAIYLINAKYVTGEVLRVDGGIAM